MHHERQAKIAAQDNAAMLRAKYVTARKQLDSLRVSLRNCPPSKQTSQHGHDAVLVLSPPFGPAHAGGVAAVEAADGQPGRPAVPYEIFAQVEAEVRMHRRRAAGGGGAGGTSSPAPKPLRNLLGAPAWTPLSSGLRASAGNSGRPKSSPSSTGARTRATEVEHPVGHAPGGAVDQPGSPSWGHLSNDLNDLVRSVSELSPASATQPLPRVAADLFGARSPPGAAGTPAAQRGGGGTGSEPRVGRVESDGWPQLAMAETAGSPEGPAEGTAVPPGKKLGSTAAGKTSFPVNWRR